MVNTAYKGLTVKPRPLGLCPDAQNTFAGLRVEQAATSSSADGEAFLELAMEGVFKPTLNLGNSVIGVGILAMPYCIEKV